MGSHRIVLANFGSLGDLHPYLAIAGELKRRGHHPVVATVPYYQAKVEAAGFEFQPLRTAAMQEPDLALMRKIFHPRRGAEFIVRELVMPSLRTAYGDALAALNGASLLVSHPLTFAAIPAAEVSGVPWMTTQLAPTGLISAYDPPMLPLPLVSHLHSLGPAFWKTVIALGKRSIHPWTKPYAELRAELGLAPVQNPLFHAGDSAAGTLALFSKLLGAPQRDWPAKTLQTGFPFYDGEDHVLPPGLDEFLEAGAPPIVFTLGSSAVLDAGLFYQRSAQAANRLGRRAVLLVGSKPENRPASLPEGVAAFEYAPFSLLFPRAAAIVHQGGVGTTAQAMRSGRPMLVMPYAVDQPDNAARVQRLGIARVIERKAYSAKRAAHELHSLLNEPRYRENARAVGKQISRENGASDACDYLETLLR